MTDLELRVEGEVFRDWKSVQVTRSIEQLASTFAVTSSELWTDRDEEIPLRTGQICSVWAGFHRLLAGYIDADDHAYDEASNALSVKGRSTLGDLVDCSAVVDGGWIRQQTLQGVAETLCAPFGVPVKSEVFSLDIFRRFAVQLGETPLEAIERAAKARGVMVISDDIGSLVLTGPGTSRSPVGLEYGVNVKRGKRTSDWTDRFSSYTVKSQNSGSSEHKGRQASRVTAVVTDDTVNRYRPFVMVSEAQVDSAGAEARARWERNTRAGKSQRLTYAVEGWENGDGIWTPNVMVPVKDRRFGVDDDLLLITVVLTKDEQGELAELTLTRPEAFSGSATPPHPRGGKEFW